MPHAGPDWGTYAPASTIYSLQDLGELAARIGSFVNFDRLGNVIAMDNFENGIGEWYSDGDAGFSADWDSKYCRLGGFSCKLTTGPSAGNTVKITKHIGAPVLSAMGVEVSFSYEQNWRYLDIFLDLYDGTYYYGAALRFDHTTAKLQYKDSAGAFQDIAGGFYYGTELPHDFDTLKIVADFTTVKYKRLLVNNLVFDLSEISFLKDVSTNTPALTVQLRLTTSANAAAIAYIDDVIVTQNEP